MAITEAQLDTWSHQGSITNSADTGNSVKNALDTYTGFPEGISLNVYLQGTYKITLKGIYNTSPERRSYGEIRVTKK